MRHDPQGERQHLQDQARGTPPSAMTPDGYNDTLPQSQSVR